MLKFSKCERWNQYQHIIHYQPVEVERPNPDGTTTKTEEYAHTILVPEPTRAEVIAALIRKRYTANDELALLRQRTTKKAEFNEYNDFAEACKVLADQILDALDE